MPTTYLHKPRAAANATCVNLFVLGLLLVSNHAGAAAFETSTPRAPTSMDAPKPARTDTGAKFDPIREVELEKALSKYQKIERMEVSFTQKKTLRDMDMALTSEGELQLKMPDQVVYTIQKPARLVVTMKPDEIKFETGSGPSAAVQTIKTSAVAGESEKRSLQAMITWLKMDPKQLANDYDISTDHQGHYRFDPRQKDVSPFQQLQLELGSNGHVKQMTMNERSGDRIEFTFAAPKITYAKKRK